MASETGASRAGVLLLQLGTPEAPTADAVRPYLREFLTDPRVIELPRLLWRRVLHRLGARCLPRSRARPAGGARRPRDPSLLRGARVSGRGRRALPRARRVAPVEAGARARHVPRHPALDDREGRPLPRAVRA